jgi:hypothetical protein
LSCGPEWSGPDKEEHFSGIIISSKVPTAGPGGDFPASTEVTDEWLLTVIHVVYWSFCVTLLFNGVPEVSGCPGAGAES